MKNIRIWKKIFSILPFLFSASVFSQPLLRSAADLRNTPVVTMAEGGNTSAQFILGSAFYRGDEVQQDYAEAAKWFRLAAEKGHVDAQNVLGSMLIAGKGVVQDYAEAAKWFLLAAEQENPLAQSNLGGMFANGQGVTQSYVDAVKWYRRAAEQGNSGGQAGLGFMYAKGQGVEQSFEEAYFWLSLAASQSDEYRKQRDFSADFLGPQQIINVQRRASIWQPKALQKDNK